MSYDIPGFSRSYEAGADLSAKQYCFVKLSGSLIVAAAAATDNVIGVLQNKPVDATDNLHNGAFPITGTVMISGVTKVVASKAIAAGVPVYITSTGQVTDTAASNKAVGISEEAAAGANSIFAILLKPLGAFA